MAAVGLALGLALTLLAAVLGLMSIDFLALSAGYISVEQYFQA